MRGAALDREEAGQVGLNFVHFSFSMFFCQGGRGRLPSPLSSSGFLVAREAWQLPECCSSQGFQIAQLSLLKSFPKIYLFLSVMIQKAVSPPALAFRGVHPPMTLGTAELPLGETLQYVLPSTFLCKIWFDGMGKPIKTCILFSGNHIDNFVTAKEMIG